MIYMVRKGDDDKIRLHILPEDSNTQAYAEQVLFLTDNVGEARKYMRHLREAADMMEHGQCPEGEPGYGWTPVVAQDFVKEFEDLAEEFGDIADASRTSLVEEFKKVLYGLEGGGELTPVSRCLVCGTVQYRI